jgi:hypothetical protein
MNRSVKLTLLMGLILAVGISSAYAGGKEWFDMENCDMCKPLTENPQLLMHITWEQHNISNGIVSVTTVEKDYVEVYRTAHSQMDHVVGSMQKGKNVELCGMCSSMGGMMMKGLKQEAVTTTYGDVWIVTSEDPSVVADLQKWASKNKEEMMKHMKSGG